MRVQNLSEVLTEFFPGFEVKFSGERGLDSDLDRHALGLSELYTGAVAALVRHANPTLAKLGQHVWDVIHHRLVHVAMAPVPTCYFYAARTSGTMQGFVMLPTDWAAMVHQNSVMQLGAVIFTGSQAVDFHNGRLAIDGAPRVTERARSYEAELLKNVDPSILNDYQRGIVQMFANGFDPLFYYPYRDVRASQA